MRTYCIDRELYSVLCDDLKGKETPKIGNMCIYTTDSGFPGSSACKIKNPPAVQEMKVVRDGSSTPGSGRSPGGGHGNPLQHSCLENPHGQRSLVGYSPWGLKETDTTERLSVAQHCTHANLFLIVFNFITLMWP